MSDKQFPTYEQLQHGWLQMKAERDLLRAAVGVDLARIEELEKVLKELTFAARTTGGVAGPDEFLMRACRHAEFILRAADESAEHCPKCGERTDTYPVGSYHKCEESGATVGPCAMCGTTTGVHLPFCHRVDHEQPA